MAIEYRTEPEYQEYLDGVRYPKVSPRNRHGLVQGEIFAIIRELGKGRGTASVETDAILKRSGPGRTKLIPDVSFISNEQYDAHPRSDWDEPPFSPEIAVEVKSPGDSAAYLQAKFARYLATGSKLVLGPEEARPDPPQPRETLRDPSHTPLLIEKDAARSAPAVSSALTSCARERCSRGFMPKLQGRHTSPRGHHVGGRKAWTVSREDRGLVYGSGLSRLCHSGSFLKCFSTASPQNAVAVASSFVTLLNSAVYA